MIIDQPTAFIMIIPKSDQFQISPVASPEILHNTTQYQNLAFHSSLKWKMLILLLTTSSTLSEIWQGPNLLSAFQRFALESVYLERVDCNTVTYNIISECFSYLLISKLQPTYYPWILVVLSRNTSCICHHTGRRLMQRAYKWIFQVQSYRLNLEKKNPVFWVSRQTIGKHTASRTSTTDDILMRWGEDHLWCGFEALCRSWDSAWIWKHPNQGAKCSMQAREKNSHDKTIVKWTEWLYRIGRIACMSKEFHRCAQANYRRQLWTEKCSQLCQPICTSQTAVKPLFLTYSHSGGAYLFATIYQMLWSRNTFI